MKKTQILVLGAAVLAAVGAGYIALNLTRPDPAPEIADARETQQIATEEVLVASSNIEMGMKVSDDMLSWQEWPQTGVAQGFITRSSLPDAISEMSGSIARSTIYSGEPIRETKLVKSDKGFMSAILPKGQRAVATSISTATSAGGFILPNDRVDVLMTRRRTGEGEEGFATDVVLTNVRVLAIDQTISEQDGEPVVVGETATLQLNPKEVEILAVAQQTADNLSLALRSLADANEPSSQTGDHLLGVGSGTVRVIRYGTVKETSAPPRKSSQQ